MNVHAPLDAPRRLWLRVDDFMILGEAGVLDDFSKSELIDGEVITMNAQYRPHAFAQSQLLIRLAMALQEHDPRLAAVIEAAVAMPPHDMPEPDITVTSEPRGDGPVPLSSVALVVEVCNTTRTYDLGPKAALYARHLVPEYWVVDLQDSAIVRHWQPGPTGYGQRDSTPFGTTLASATLPALVISTSGLV